MKVTILKGKLTPDDYKALGEEGIIVDKTDIPLTVYEDAEYDHLEISQCCIPVLVKNGGFKVNRLTTNNTSGDNFLAWCGGINIMEHNVNDVLPYVYTRFNHKDSGAQFLSMCPKTFKRNVSDFVGLFIGAADLFIRGAKKAGYHFTEICKYKNVWLFPFGIIFDTDSEYPYFISTTNATNWVIGSPEHPIDVDLVSNKGIRIGSNEEQGSPASENIVIHAYPGLKLDLNESAKKALTLVEYDRDWTIEKRLKYNNTGVV